MLARLGTAPLSEPGRRADSSHCPAFVAEERHGGALGMLQVGGEGGDAWLAAVEAVELRGFQRIGGGAAGAAGGGSAGGGGAVGEDAGPVEPLGAGAGLVELQQGVGAAREPAAEALAQIGRAS